MEAAVAGGFSRRLLGPVGRPSPARYSSAPSGTDSAELRDTLRASEASSGYLFIRPDHAQPEPTGGTMTGKALKTFSTAVVQRIAGERPGRTRAVAASVIAGVAVGGGTYRLLRSKGSSD